MIFEHNSPVRHKKIMLVIAILILAAGIFILIYQNSKNEEEQVFCTQEAKLCPDGSYVGRTGPNCEFESCPEASLPQGYSLDTYRIEKVLDVSCVEDSECETPGEYAIQSRCPFTSLCLEKKCTVVCPGTVR